MRTVNWTSLLNEVIKDLATRKKTHRAVGSDGEELELYLKPHSIHLMKLKEDLKLQKYKPRPLLVKLLSKSPDEVPRKVFVPTNRDYLVARAINLELTLATKVSSPSAKKLLRTLISEVSSNDKKFSSVARLDLRDFFGSIPYEKTIKSMLANESIHNDIIHYLQLFSEEASIATLKKGAREIPQKEIAPQGLPYSPAIANWYVEEIHQKGKKWLSQGTLFRYLDDILILFEAPTPYFKVQWHLYKLEKLFSRNGLTIHPIMRDTPGQPIIDKNLQIPILVKDSSKSQIIRPISSNRDFIFLGLSMTLEEDGKISYRIPEKVIKTEKTKLWQLFHRCLRPNGSSLAAKNSSPSARVDFLRYRLLLKSNGCRYQGKVYGFLNYWSFSDDASAFKLLDIYIGKLEKEFAIELRGSRNITDTPEFNSSYFRNFQKIRESDYREKFELDFDKITGTNRIDFLTKNFEVNRGYLETLSKERLEAFWHERLRGEIDGLFSSGYPSY